MNIQVDEIVPAEDLCINSSCINEKLTEKARIAAFLLCGFEWNRLTIRCRLFLHMRFDFFFMSI